MSIRFWRRIRLFPGVTLNVSKTGISFSFGRRGVHWTIGRRGHTGTIGLSGTGLFYSKRFSHEEVLTETKSILGESEENTELDRIESDWEDFK